MSQEPKVTPRKIRYAPGIQYFEGALTLQDPATLRVWKESEDNPMSPHFVPLEARPEGAKARWWATYNRRTRQQPTCGVFD